MKNYIDVLWIASIFGIVILLSICHTRAQKDLAKEINSQWLSELDNRGLIIRNKEGGFTFKDE